MVPSLLQRVSLTFGKGAIWLLSGFHSLLHWAISVRRVELGGLKLLDGFFTDVSRSVVAPQQQMSMIIVDVQFGFPNGFLS